MDLEKAKYNLTLKLNGGLKYFVSTSFVMFFFFILIRIFELSVVWNAVSGQAISFNHISIALFYDALIYLNISFLIGIAYFVLILLHKKIANIILNTISVFFISGYSMLDAYFSKTSIPLGSDLFGYSVAEIKKTVSASGGFNLYYAAIFLIIIAVVVYVHILFRRIKLNKIIIYTVCFLMAVSYLFGKNFYPNPGDFSNTSLYYLLVNKLEFFTTKTYAYFFEKEGELPLSNYYIDSGDEINSFIYSNPDYPFLHEEKSTDVLGNYFNITESKPNFVFIITESLGRGYSGENAYMGSFTPFLDSLAKESLYWENFLSTGGRTFAALPSIFASLPFGEKGFLEAGENMPPHFSFIKYLRKQGYNVNFYYGSSSSFDMMDLFLRKQGINKIIDENNFGPGYKKMPSKGNGFSWGYGDKELFDRGYKEINTNDMPNQVNIFLTISMHNPFLVENQDYYRAKFDKIYAGLKLNQETYGKLKEYRDILSCVLYTDDAFREFFNKYKKREDYKNTIFIITGDHRMPEIPITTQADRFHVPLIIYSPMLKRKEKFSSISSHFDITPSLISFLSNNYKMDKISSSVFMGSGLDTTRQFRNIHNYPLMRNKNELLDYLYQGYFYSDKILYMITDNMNIIPFTDNAAVEKIETEFAEFRKKNDYMVKTKKLLPDSLLK